MINSIDPIKMLTRTQVLPPVQFPRIKSTKVKLVLTTLPNIAQELKVLRPFGMFNPLVIESTEVKGPRMLYSTMYCYKPGDYFVWEVAFRNTGSIPLPCILKYGDREEKVTLNKSESAIRQVSLQVVEPKKITLEASITPREKPLSLLFAGDSRKMTYNIGVLSYKDKPLSEYPMSEAINVDYTGYLDYDAFVIRYEDWIKPEGNWCKSTWKVEFGGVTREKDINNILYREPDSYISISVEATLEVTQAARVIPMLYAAAFYEDGYHTSAFVWTGEITEGSEVKVAVGESKTFVFDRMNLPVEFYGKLFLLPYLIVYSDDYQAWELLGPGQYGYLGGELLAP